MKGCIYFFIGAVFILGLLALGTFIFLDKNPDIRNSIESEIKRSGQTPNSIFNSPKMAGLSVACGDVANLALAAEVLVKVRNDSDRTHNDVNVRIISFDKNGNIINEKLTTFDRSLHAHSELIKPVTLKAKARSCKCILENSNPQ